MNLWNILTYDSGRQIDGRCHGLLNEREQWRTDYINVPSYSVAFSLLWYTCWSPINWLLGILSGSKYESPMM